ncbi:MAG: AraC family transcriptional regulator [Thermoanaerobaculia bacterium]|jgi:AraC family transcriptional regulator of adaptative response / DNA-3-methyladenine glycosylase II|nr:AraC family transcriptional regulator [Thermoanaerobaculia bacterium]
MQSRNLLSVIRLHYTPPYDWTGILNFLRPRAIAGVETVTDDAYERGGIRVTHDSARKSLIVSDEAARVRTMFDIDGDIAAIEKQFSRDKTLAPLVRKFPGIRVPGTWDPFEMAIRAIVGQQISVAGATTLMARIASRHGVTPQSLMRARTNPGMPQTRWNTIRGLARAVARGEVTFERGATLEESIANLTKLPGIGPWTAHYIAMRALREPDAFPHTDLGIRKAAGMITDRELLSRAEAWRPYRAYATMLLWRSL